MAKSTHYIVNITVEEVVTEDGKTDRGYKAEGVIANRTVNELTRVVSSRPSLDAARRFAVGMLELLDDEKAQVAAR